tara:strand:+ start:1040 stop:2245 length:1206 start_codon:yes stop_codon:yes gene_type:complete
MVTGAPVNILDFGADPTGVASSSAAIQSAVDTGKAVYIPEGTYKITATINVPLYAMITGAGQTVSILDGSTLADADAIFFLTGGDQHATIDQLQFKGQASGSKSIGIKVSNGYSVSYTNNWFVNLSYGLLLDEAGSCIVQNNTFKNCLFGAKCMGGSGYTFSFNNFNEASSTGIAVDVSPTTGFPTSIIVSQCLFTTAESIVVPTAPGIYGGHNFTADNCYFEGSEVICQPFKLGTGSGTPLSVASITNCRMALTASLASTFTNCDVFVFLGNLVGTVATFPTSVLQLTYGSNVFVSGLVNSALRTINLDSLKNFSFLADRIRPITDGTALLGDDVFRFKAAFISESVILGTGVLVTTGINSPEGVLTAPQGSLFLRTNGGANTTLYVKESGTGNTGWVTK